MTILNKILTFLINIGAYKCAGNSRPLTTLLGHEGTNAAPDDGSADGAVPQAGSTITTHHQVTAGDEDDGHQLVHAHLTGPLLLQLPEQLLWTRVLDCVKTHTQTEEDTSTCGN